MPTELQLARCREESLLPDVGTLHARMLLGAWEVGLEDVSDEAARLLCVAVEVRAGATGEAQPLVSVNMHVQRYRGNDHKTQQLQPLSVLVEGCPTLPAARVQALQVIIYASLNSSFPPQHQVKNVLICISAHRSSWRVREGTPFRHSYGHGRMSSREGRMAVHREPVQLKWALRVGMMWWEASGNCLCAVSLMPSPPPPLVQ